MGNEQRNVMICGRRSYRLIDGFLEADEALIKLEQFSH
jgi:hypothetical protein